MVVVVVKMVLPTISHFVPLALPPLHPYFSQVVVNQLIISVYFNTMPLGKNLTLSLSIKSGLWTAYKNKGMVVLDSYK